MVIDANSYKTGLIREIINSETIVKGIDTQQDGVFSNDDLIYRNIFPFLHVNFTQTIADCYILLGVDFPSINRINNSFTDVQMTIWVLCHIDRMKVKGINGTRIDYLSDELRKMLDGSTKYGCGGRLEVVSSREIVLDQKYIYRDLRMKTTDLTAYANSKVGRFN
jgi:hypothetical protein